MAEKPLQDGVQHGVTPLVPGLAAEMSSSLYGKPHRLAATKMRFERGNHTLQSAALRRLAEFDPRQAEILKLHFFAGFTFEEITLQLRMSARTVKRDWSMARAWLRQELSTTR